MTRTPKVFVGASTEAEEYDELVRGVLAAEGIEPIPWQTSFRPGDYGLDSLERITSHADGAILIASADDRTWYRGQETFVPRDNVLLELGYFLQAYGRKRTAIVQVQGASGAFPRVPTDLAGLTGIRFRPRASAANALEIQRWAQRFVSSFRSLHPEIRDIVRILREDYEDIDPGWEDVIRSLVLSPIRRAALSALRGELLLTPGQYYGRLDAEIAAAGPDTKIYAVSTISSQVWSSDRDQQQYFASNIAAARRGAEIRRLFVLPGHLHADLRDVIRRQREAGIDVRIARPGTSADFSTLDDVVLFMDSHPVPRIRGYIGLPVFDNPGRIRGGKLLLDANLCHQQREAFVAAWALAATIGADNDPHDPHPPSVSEHAPGETMRPAWLARQVVTCREAAAARGVPLQNELKTLIIETPGGLVAAHVTGDSEIALRAVKDLLEIDQAQLASPQTLRNLDLSPGTISAVLNPVWSLPHLVDRAVLKLSFVTTNNGTTTGYFRFSPSILLSAWSITVADIARPVDT